MGKIINLIRQWNRKTMIIMQEGDNE